MTESDEDLLREMEELRQGFLSGLPPRMLALNVALDELHKAIDSGWDGTVLEHLRASAHKLRGTAGCYGEDALSAAAGDLEDCVLGVLKSDRLLSAEGRRTTLQSFRSHLDELQRIAHELRGGSS